MRDGSQNVLDDRDVSWGSANVAVASVNDDGVVTAVGVGSAVITATSENKLGVVLLTVSQPVGVVEVSAPSPTLIIGSSQYLAATMKDAAGVVLTNRAVTWSSSDPAVATVNSTTGLVSAVSAGSATMTATSEGRTGTAIISVTSDQIAPATISAGLWHSCGLTKAGKAYCWGVGGYFGSGQNEVSRGPLPVTGGHTFVAISVGLTHTIALTPLGDVYSWGENSGGALGIGSSTFGAYFSPQLVTGGLKFKAIDAGATRNLGLTVDGKVYFWGQWYPGDGLNGFNVSIPTPTPVALPQSLTFKAVSIGYHHALVLSEGGAAYAWGEGRNGELGEAAYRDRITPILVSGGHTFTSIVAAYTTSFGLTADGKVYQWGGILNGAPASTPTLTTGLPALTMIHGNAKVAGITSAGAAWVWSGGSTASNPAWTEVPTLRFLSVTGGEEHVMGITTAGEAWGVGRNDGNQLGNGGFENSTAWVGPAAPSYSIAMPTSASVEAGKTTTMTVTVTRNLGGFTIHGLRQHTGDITLAVEAGPGLTATLSPAVITPGMTSTTLTLSAASTASGPASVIVTGTASGATMRSAGGATLTVTPPATPGAMDLVCPTGSAVLPTGYHCMTNSANQHVPGKYSHAALHGSWVDESAGVCLTWGSNGRMSGKYKGGSFGPGGPIADGEWGVIVLRSGTPVGTTTQWYVFSETADDQLKMLGYDSGTNSIMGWNFVKRTSCPAW